MRLCKCLRWKELLELLGDEVGVALEEITFLKFFDLMEKVDERILKTEKNLEDLERKTDLEDMKKEAISDIEQTLREIPSEIRKDVLEGISR